MDWSWDISLALLLKVLKIPLNVSELMSNRQNELKSLLGMSKMMSYRQNELKSLLDMSEMMPDRQKSKNLYNLYCKFVHI